MTEKRVILGSFWFSGCGVVRVKTEYDGIKYYICGTREGRTQKEDENLIANWGSTFPKEAGDALFGIKS